MSSSYEPHQNADQWTAASGELVPSEQPYGQGHLDQTQQQYAQQPGQNQYDQQNQYAQNQYTQNQYGQPAQQYAQDQYAQQPQMGQPYGTQGGFTQPMGMAVSAPYGIEPTTGLPYSDKSKTAAGLLGIFFGSLGIGRFYKGDVGIGIAQLVVSICTLGVGSLWGFIDGIIMLTGRPLDKQGRPLR